MRPWTFALCVLVAGCARPSDAEVTAEPALTAASAAPVESTGGKAPLGPPPEGLALELARKGPERIPAGSGVEVTAALVNRSRDKNIPVIQSGDGSDFGWREPHVFWVVDVDDGSGRWSPAPGMRPGRCGNYDEDWTDEISTLAPAKRLELQLWTGPEFFADMAGARRARIRMGYRYGTVEKRGAPADVPAAMAGVGPFELLSNPIEIEFAHDWTLDLAVVGNIRANAEVRVADLFDLRLVSHTNTTAEVRAPGWLHGSPLTLEVQEVRDARERRDGSERVLEEPSMDEGVERPSIKLGPRESTKLLGDTERFGRYDGKWKWPTAGTVHVRAAFHGVQNLALRSPWVTVVVE
jgi:hypothetical protein